MLTDYHVHTAFSCDSNYPMEDVLKDAIRLNLEEIAFTDHVDYGVRPDHDEYVKSESNKKMPPLNVDYPRYFAKIAEMKQKYAHQIRILAGLEMGIQRHTVERYQKLFAQWPLEFVILSIHQVDNLELWKQDYMRGKSQREFQQGQYLELLEAVRHYKDYCVVGHVDLIKRYDRNPEYPFEEYRDILEEVFKTVIADGKGIEVNTSSARYHLPDFQPSTDILKLYRALGGEVITVGSDSHKPEHLASYIQVARNHLKDLGFKYYCSYEEMQPIFHKL